MKVLGLTCGRKSGNSEFLTKEALMGVEEQGIDSEIVRLLDLDIKPCRFCKVCLKTEGGPEACVIKDDAAFLWNAIMECDGLIITAPVYSTTPPGYFFQVCDRVLERNADVAGARELKKEKERGASAYLDERVFKTRYGGLISLGASVTPHWLAFGINLIYTRIFPLDINMVDQMQVLGTGINKGQVLLNDSAIARARALGKHIAEAMSKPVSELKWMGDESGICPVCHSNLLTVADRNPVECPICGIKGEISLDGDRIKVNFSQEEQERSRLKTLGKWEHWKEYNPDNPEEAYEQGLSSTIPKSMEKLLMEEIAIRRVKYETYKTCLKPENKAEK